MGSLSGVDVAEKDVGDGVRAGAAGVPGFQNGADLADPRHGHRTTGFNHYDSVWIGRGDGGDHSVLMIGKGEAVEVHVFAFPLVDEHDGDVGGLSDSRGCSRIGAGVELHIGSGSLGAN